MGQKKKEFVLKNVTGPWHELIDELPELSPEKGSELTPEKILEHKKSAQEILEEHSKKYEAGTYRVSLGTLRWY